MPWAAAGAIGGALIGANASNKAAKGQQQAAGDATAASQREAARVRADQTPYREAGYGALQQINALLGITPQAVGGQQSTYDQIRERLLPNYVGNYGGNGINDAALDAAAQAEYARVQQQGQRVPSPTQTGMGQQPATNPLQALQNMPGYQFGMQQGQQALEHSAAARGGIYSGNMLRATQRYGQDYAGTKFGEHYNRLASVAGLGQTSLGTTANTGMAFGYQAGQNAIGAGNAGAANALNQGNIWGNAMNQIGAYGSRNGWFSGGGGGGIDPNGYLGGPATAGDYSDARLKTNIRPIGRTARGNTVYAWDWKTGGSGRGVIAQEVTHIPGAVHADADGLLMVDYSKV